MTGLPARLTLGILVTFLLLLLAYVSVVDPALRQTMLNAEREKVRVHAATTAAHLDRTVRSAVAELEAIARLDDVRSMEPARMTAVLAVFEEIHPTLEALTVLDIDGTVVARPDAPGLVGSDRDDDPAYAGARQEGETALPPARTLLGAAEARIGTPVRNDESRLVGVLTAVIGEAAPLYDAITDPATPATWQSFLASDDGRLLAASDVPVIGTDTDGRDVSEHPSVRLAWAGRWEDQILDVGRAGWFAASARVPATGWTVVVQQPRAQFIADIDDFTDRIALVFGAIFLALLIVSLFAGRQLIEPLTKLTGVLREYGRTGRALPVEVRGNNEAATALAAFNEMLHERDDVQSALDRHRRHLEELVDRRTSDLARLELALDVGRMCVWQWDAANDEVTWSDNAPRLHGSRASSDDFARTFDDYLPHLHPDERERFRVAFPRMLASASVQDNEFRVVSPDDGVRWMRGVGRMVRDDLGHGTQMIGVVADVTDRKRAEAAVMARAAQQAAVGSLSGRALVETELAPLLDAAVELVAEVLGTASCWILRVTTERDTLSVAAASGGDAELPSSLADQPAVRRAMEGGPPASDAVDRVEGSLTVVIEGRDRPFGVLVVRGEPERVFSSQETDFVYAVVNVLAGAVLRRQAEERLFQAHKMEAVGRLAGSVAHDFNNLLTAMLGYTELLADSVTDDRGRMSIEEVQLAGRRAAALVDQLLTFSRGRMTNRELVNLDSVVQGMRGMLAPLVGVDVELQLLSREGLRLVEADSHQLEQVVLNLAINARDAMPAGGVLTVVTDNVDVDAATAARLDAAPGPYTLLRVADSGLGMTPSTVAQAFEPFFTTKQPGRGTGLGLSTVYGIVRDLDGRIDLESRPGQGTTVSILIPSARTDLALPPTAVVEGPPPRAGAETVLLVEDQAAVRALVAELLSGRGYQVLEASNGQEALDRYGDLDVPIDLLVTDIVMPQIGGPELAQRLREGRVDLRVLFISGYSDDPAAAQAVDGPATAFLQKPFELRDLLRTVRELLDRP